MKRMICSLTALLLLVSMLIPTAVSAAEVTEDGHVISRPELLELFVFPGNWSDNALKFCVGNGIMTGRGNDLAAGANTTRAETAALIVRLLGATVENPDLSRFADVKPGAWYYGELASAVDLGILSGVSPTALAPNVPITREQVFTLLSRAFGLYPQDSSYWRNFSDCYSVSDYARDAVSVLAEMGIVNGYADGSVKPKQYITRAELAQLFYNLFTCVCDDPADLPDHGTVLYRGTEPLPQGYTLEGDLIIGCGLSGDQTLKNLRVSGTMTLRPQPGSVFRLSDCTAGRISIPAVMTVSGTAGEVVSGGKGSVLNIEAENIQIFADCTVTQGQKMLVCQGDHMTLTLNAHADKCVINGKNTLVKGSGSVHTMEINAPGWDIQVPVEMMTENPYLNPEFALDVVQTLEVWDVVTKDTWLYSGRNLTGRVRELPAGTLLDHFYLHPEEGVAEVYTEDGVYGWVDADCIEIPTEVELAEPYSTEMMEAFVNQKGYKSSTEYLIWVSLKTQTVNVFRGSKGAWTLIRTMPCASGKNSTPTIRGEFYTKVYYWEWLFGTYKVKYATTFQGNYAFHSRIWSNDYKVLLDDTIGWPASDGCVRMLDEDCEYIFKKIPQGTRVVVY